MTHNFAKILFTGDNIIKVSSHNRGLLLANIDLARGGEQCLQLSQVNYSLLRSG